MSQELVAIDNEPRAVAVQTPLSVEQLRSQVNLIQSVMQAVMKKDEHYGVIPGCGDKPALLKPGAEKLCLTFRMAPSYRIDVKDLGNGHREYSIVCSITNIKTKEFMGEGVGSCSTLETKYRYRQGERKCPKCTKTSIIKGKQEFGGGWLCFAKKGGCGAKFTDSDPAISSQTIGRVENTDVADQYNTILKMAKKRALVDATLTVTAASDIFAQDIEEFVEAEVSQTLQSSPIQMPKAKPLSKAPITEEERTALRKKFHALADGAGLTDDDKKRFLVAICKTDSTKTLTREDFELLFSELKNAMEPPADASNV